MGQGDKIRLRGEIGLDVKCDKMDDGAKRDEGQTQKVEKWGKWDQ